MAVGIQSLCNEDLPDRVKFEIVQEPDHSFLCCSDLPVTDETLDRRKRDPWRKGIEI